MSTQGRGKQVHNVVIAGAGIHGLFHVEPLSTFDAQETHKFPTGYPRREAPFQHVTRGHTPRGAGAGPAQARAGGKPPRMAAGPVGGGRRPLGGEGGGHQRERAGR